MRVLFVYECGHTETSQVGKGITFESLRKSFIGKEIFTEFQMRTILDIKELVE